MQVILLFVMAAVQQLVVDGAILDPHLYAVVDAVLCSFAEL